MQKARIVATKQQRNVLNEKRIMMECDHPYVRASWSGLLAEAARRH